MHKSKQEVYIHEEENMLWIHYHLLKFIILLKSTAFLSWEGPFKCLPSPGTQVDTPPVCLHPVIAYLEAVDVQPAEDFQKGGEVRHVVFQEVLHLEC